MGVSFSLSPKRPLWLNNKENFYRLIAESQDQNFQNYPFLKNLKSILLEDMGHKFLIRGDEPFIAILVANQLKKEVFSVPIFNKWTCC